MKNIFSQTFQQNEHHDPFYQESTQTNFQLNESEDPPAPLNWQSDFDVYLI